MLREIPWESASRFLTNEFLEDDINKFRTLAEARTPVDYLDRVTQHHRATSVVVHASKMAGLRDGGRVAVVIEPVKPAELAPILLAHGLTRREGEVAQLALQARRTSASLATWASPSTQSRTI